MLTKGRPADQVFCNNLLSDGLHMLCGVCFEDNKYQALYITSLDGSEWKLLSKRQEYVYSSAVNHAETHIAFHVASEGYTITTINMDGNE